MALVRGENLVQALRKLCNNYAALINQELDGYRKDNYTSKVPVEHDNNTQIG